VGGDKAEVVGGGCGARIVRGGLDGVFCICVRSIFSIRSIPWRIFKLVVSYLIGWKINIS
jgi:hypothetical protein